MGAGIRASYTKLAMRHFRRGHAGNLEQLSVAAGEGAIDDVRRAGPLEWLPAELHGALADAMIEVLGRSEARALWANVMLEAFGHPILAPIVGGAFAIYGKVPSSVMRMTPHAWPLFFRECGQSWMEPASDSGATMSFAELPRAIMGSTASSTRSSPTAMRRCATHSSRAARSQTTTSSRKDASRSTCGGSRSSRRRRSGRSGSLRATADGMAATPRSSGPNAVAARHM